MEMNGVPLRFRPRCFFAVPSPPAEVHTFQAGFQPNKLHRWRIIVSRHEDSLVLVQNADNPNHVFEYSWNSVCAEPGPCTGYTLTPEPGRPNLRVVKPCQVVHKVLDNDSLRFDLDCVGGGSIFGDVNVKFL